MYSKDGYKDGSLVSEGSYYSSASDYTNWKDTNRFTLGLGYNVDKWNFDLAWQYSATNGTFYPYTSYAVSYDDGTPDVIMSEDKFDVTNKRHQLLLTVGYHF